jgi:histidyl-tRNA synthetase
MAKATEPPSGTRDFLAADVRRRKAAFNAIASVFERYGFDPLDRTYLIFMGVRGCDLRFVVDQG